MKRLHLELVFITLFVIGGTSLTYWLLADAFNFWDNQEFWSLALLVCWGVVSLGYYRQGWIVHKAKSATHVSLFLPIVVFIVQCILFIKGIHYHDYALIVGAILVNSGVAFNIYQIIIFRK